MKKLYYGGNIITMQDGNLYTEALLIGGDKILDLGDKTRY